jgi:hypothetical protein
VQDQWDVRTLHVADAAPLADAAIQPQRSD